MIIKLFNLLFNRHDKYAIVDINKRLREVYIKGNNEAVYLAYRNITGATVQESWQVVKPWVREWEGKDNG